MKRLLLLFIPLVFFFSCELFEEEENSWLDEDLFGTWKSEGVYIDLSTLTPAIGEFYYNFNQNGTYEYFGGGNTKNGDWWVDGDVLLTSIVGDDGIPNSRTYDVSDDTLRFHNENPGFFYDEDGNLYLEEGDPPFYQYYIKQ